MIEDIIYEVERLIKNMSEERERFVGRIRQIDDDIDRLIRFKEFLKRKGKTDENND